MPTLLKKYPVSLAHIISDPVFIVHSITERKLWVDKQPTNEIEGYLYECCSTQKYRSINVFVKGKDPVIPLKEFEMLQDMEQPLFVELENARLSVYFSYKTNSIEDKITATDVHVVEIEG